MENFEQEGSLSSQPSPTPQPSSKRRYLFIGIIVTVIVVVGGGILSLPLQKETPSQPELTEPEIVIDISNWQTYRNDKDGYEIKYPSDWTQSQRNSSIPFTNAIEFKKFRELKKDPNLNFIEIVDVQSIKITAIANSLGKIPSERWYREEWTLIVSINLQPTSFEETTFMGLSALKVRNGEGGEIFFAKDAKIFRVEWSVSETNINTLLKTTEQIFEKMLSTFQFIQ